MLTSILMTWHHWWGQPWRGIVRYCECSWRTRRQIQTLEAKGYHSGSNVHIEGEIEDISYSYLIDLWDEKDLHYPSTAKIAKKNCENHMQHSKDCKNRENPETSCNTTKKRVLLVKTRLEEKENICQQNQIEIVFQFRSSFLDTISSIWVDGVAKEGLMLQTHIKDNYQLLLRYCFIGSTHVIQQCPPAPPLVMPQQKASPEEASEASPLQITSFHRWGITWGGTSGITITSISARFLIWCHF